VGSNDVKGTAMPANAHADRKIAIGQGTRWVNVEYGETVEFTVAGAGGRRVVWRFDGSADRLDLSELDREAGLNVPIYVNQTNNPMRQPAGY
jgi:heavy-metal resistance protein CzcE